MVLVNTLCGKRTILGRSVKSFAKEHGLSLNGFSKLVNGRRILYRGWCLEKSMDLITANLPVK